MQRERGWELRLVRDLEIDGEPVRPSEDTVLTTSPFLLESGPSLLDILRLSFHTDLSQAPPTAGHSAFLASLSLFRIVTAPHIVVQSLFFLCSRFRIRSINHPRL
jgi:hypothetical protein